MSIFDIFTFKKQAESVFSKANIEGVLLIARSAIIEQAKAKFPGQEKKAKVDAQVIYAIQQKVVTCNNKLLLWLISIIIRNIPAVTQLVYDFLKQKVDEL